MFLFRVKSLLKRAIPHSAAFLFLLLLVALFFWRLWTPNLEERRMFPVGDLTTQYYPLRYFVAATLAEGNIPFWNPYIFGGQPGLADPQAAVLYPPALLNALFWGSSFSLAALQLEVVAHILLAACGTYLFVRLALQLSMIPSLTAAIIFGFGGYLTGFPIEQVTILETLAWLPWLLLTLHHACPTPANKLAACATSGGTAFSQRLVSAALASLVFGCAVLAGHPQSALYLAYLGASYAFLLMAEAWPMYVARRNMWRRWLLSALLVMLPFVLGMGLAAAQLLPTWHFIEESSRKALTYQFVQGGLRWSEFTDILLPKLVGSTPLYVGILPLLLAPLGLVSGGQRMQKRFWGGMALVSLLLSLGGNTAFFDLLYLGLPSFASIRNQERVLFIWNWSMALLAAWGMASLLSRDERERRRWQQYMWWLAQFMLILFLPWLPLWLWQLFGFASSLVKLEIFDAFFNRYRFLLLIFLLSWGLLALYRHRMIRSRWYTAGFAFLLLVFLSCELFFVTHRTHIGPHATLEIIPHNEIVDALFAWQAKAPSRVGIVGQPRPSGNDGMYWSIPFLSGNEPLKLEKSRKFFNNPFSWRHYQLLGANYVVADENLADNAPDAFELLATTTSEPKSYLFRIRIQMPYVWLVGQVEYLDGDNANYRRLEEASFDPHLTALIENDGLTTLAGNDVSKGQLSLQKHHTGLTEVHVENPAHEPVLLIFAEPRARGWQLFLNGKRERIWHVNQFNMAALVPSGTHLVTLKYEQPGWQPGLRISSLCLFIIMGMIVAGSLGNRLDIGDRRL